MKKKMVHGNAFRILISIMAVLCLFLGFAPAASAAEGASTGLTQTEQADFEAGLETLFTKYVVQDGDMFVVDEEAAKNDGYADSINDFHTVADALNVAGQYGSPNAGIYATALFNVGNFASCVVSGALGIPVSAFGAGTWAAIVTAIKAWNWGLAANTIARALGPAFLKGAGKYLGGPAVIAATMAGAAAVCAWQNK